MLNAVINCVCV